MILKMTIELVEGKISSSKHRSIPICSLVNMKNQINFTFGELLINEIIIKNQLEHTD